MLPKNHTERIKIDTEKAKEWIQKGALPSNRVHIFLNNVGILDKPVITEKTKKHLPKKKAQERLAKDKEADKTTTAGEVKEESLPKETQKINGSSDNTKKSKDSKSNKTKTTKEKEEKKPS